MKYLSLFSGVGGFELAIHQVFAKAECLGFCEIDPVLTRFYKTKYPQHTPLGNVTSADFKPFFNKVDLLVAGFPCCDLSIINIHRKNLDGKKSSLFSEIVRCMQECSPRYFLIENVARLSADVRAELDAAFGVKGIPLNSNSCSAQNRNRMFWFNWTLTNTRILHPDPVISLVSVLEPKKAVKILQLNEEKAAFYEDDPTSLRRIRHISDKNKSGTLTSAPANVIVDKRFRPPMKRKLAAVEMERLQTFPEHYTKDLSYSKCVFAMKNAITVALVRNIFEDLKLVYTE